MSRAEADRHNGPNAGRHRRRRDRALLAPAIAAPGALPLIWVFMIAQFDSAVAVYLGWLPGLAAAALIAGLAYATAEIVPRHRRTVAAITVGAAFNILYIAAIATYVALRPP